MSTPEGRSYEIGPVLGRGGFGTVYSARMLSSGGFAKQVALKVLNPEVASSAGIVQRLRDEARMLGLLRHRAVVHVHGLTQLDDRWVVVMELVEGVTLSDLLQLGPLPPSVALEICEEVASALEVAYERPSANGEVLRLLHRDIKPSNVQLTSQGEVKLLDFGVARADFGEREAQTRSLILGSVDYLAPERLAFQDTHAGDVYALAATLYELLGGVALGRTSTQPGKHSAHLQQRRLALAKAGHDPTLLDALFAGLRYEEEERPTAAEFSRTLRELRRRHNEPWLREWSERLVPQVRDRNPPERDDWSGSTVSEAGASAISSDTMSFTFGGDPRIDRAANTFTDLPVLDSPPQAAPSPPKAPPKPRRRWWLRGCLAVTIAVALGVVVGIASVGIAVPTGVYALLSAGGVLDTAWEESVLDGMASARTKVSACAPSPAKDRVLDVLHRGDDRAHAAELSFWELIMFDVLISEITTDRHITDPEARKVELRFDTISRPPSAR